MPFNGIGSWTIRSGREESGLEPDECDFVGDTDEDRPDFAIEVVWTYGGMNKLEIHRALGVREVWIWKDGRITVHALRAGG